MIKHACEADHIRDRTRFLTTSCLVILAGLSAGAIGVAETCGQETTAAQDRFIQNVEATQNRFVAEVEALGGKCFRIESLPGRPLDLVSLRNTKITDDGLSALKYAVFLKTLDLTNTGITDAGLVHLSGLLGLEGLNLLNTKISDAGLVHLKRLIHMKVLSLSRTSVTSQGLFHLRDMTALKSLYLTETKVTDGGLAHLQRMSNLQSLLLSNDSITDAGIAQLRPLRHLKQLRIFKTQITDEGLASLKSLSELEDLMIALTPITDTGLMHIKELKNLKRIDITGTQVTNAGVEALQAALPRLTIVDARLLHQPQDPLRSTGAAPADLLINRSVQEELRLDANQSRRIVDLAKDTQTKINAASVAVRDLPPEVQRENFWRILNWYDREIDKQLTQIFTAAQVQRFHQIRYQVGGAASMNRQELQEKLTLTQTQREAISNLVKDYEDGSRAILMSLGLNKEGASFDRHPADGKISALKKDVLRRALELLGANQRSLWDSLTGKPFEFVPNTPTGR